MCVEFPSFRFRDLSGSGLGWLSMNRKRDSSELSQDSSGIPDKSPRARSVSTGGSESDELTVVEVEMDDESRDGEEGRDQREEAEQDNQMADKLEVDQPSKPEQSYAEAMNKKPKLFVYSSEHSQSPLRFQAFLEFRKILASKFAKAVMEKSISPEINCDQIFYDREEGNAVVTCDNTESAAWLKKAISSIKVENLAFRAWEEGEKPKKFQMRLFLPDAYQQVDVEGVKAAVGHFNPGVVDTFEVKKESTLRSGRLLEVEVGPLFFQYCRERKGKIRFMMGPLDCTPPLLPREVRQPRDHQASKAPNGLPSQARPMEGRMNGRDPKKATSDGQSNRGLGSRAVQSQNKPERWTQPSPGERGQEPPGHRTRMKAGHGEKEKCLSPPDQNQENGLEHGQNGLPTEDGGWQVVQRKK